LTEAKAKSIVGNRRMESTAFFEKKIGLTPTDLNKLKNVPIDSILLTKSKELIENKCSEHGFVLPGSLKLISRSMGYFESARFTGDAIYYVKLEGKIIYPADGVRIIGEVIRNNKMGLYVEYEKAIRVQLPRDLHLGSKEYHEVEIGDKVQLELKRSKFQINDPYILASGIFIDKYDPHTPPGSPPTSLYNQPPNSETEEDDAQTDEDSEPEEEDIESEDAEEEYTESEDIDEEQPEEEEEDN